MTGSDDPAFPADLLSRPAPEAARLLVGAWLAVDGVGGRIVETEAYDASDPASHSFGGRTARNASMFGPAGIAYVYRSYGIHWCFNLVCGPPGRGEAVLVRALEPLAGLERMRARRGGVADRLLCAGPGRLCQALGLDRGHDGLPLWRPPFELRAASVPAAVLAGPRIGISRAVERPWRFVLAGSRFLSRPMRDAPSGPP